MLTPERRAAIRALRASVIDPPWTIEGGRSDYPPDYVYTATGRQVCRTIIEDDATPDGTRLFIADAPTAIDDLLAENAELRALVHQLTRAHKGDCPSQFGRACTCGLEADQIQVRGLIGELPNA